MTPPTDHLPSSAGPLRVVLDRGQRRISLSGELDLATAPQLVGAARGYLGQGDFTMDLADVSFIGAAGLNALVEIVNHQREQGQHLWLVGINPQVRRAFHAGGLTYLIAQPNPVAAA